MKRKNTKYIYCVAGRWLQLASGDSNFLYAAVAVVDNFMYVCGGMGKPAHARGTCLRLVVTMILCIFR